jgi:transposase
LGNCFLSTASPSWPSRLLSRADREVGVPLLRPVLPAAPPSPLPVLACVTALPLVGLSKDRPSIDVALGVHSPVPCQRSRAFPDRSGRGLPDRSRALPVRVPPSSFERPRRLAPPRVASLLQLAPIMGFGPFRLRRCRPALTVRSVRGFLAPRSCPSKPCSPTTAARYRAPVEPVRAVSIHLPSAAGRPGVSRGHVTATTLAGRCVHRGPCPLALSRCDRPALSRGLVRSGATGLHPRVLPGGPPRPSARAVGGEWSLKAFLHRRSRTAATPFPARGADAPLGLSRLPVASDHPIRRWCARSCERKSR